VTKKITPLHLAENAGNNRCMNILLKYMAKSDANASETISDILPRMVDLEGFITYMEGLTFCSIQMENKQTLKIEEQYNEDIVAILGAPCSYVDNAYFAYYANE